MSEHSTRVSGRCINKPAEQLACNEIGERTALHRISQLFQARWAENLKDRNFPGLKQLDKLQDVAVIAGDRNSLYARKWRP